MQDNKRLLNHCEKCFLAGQAVTVRKQLHSNVFALAVAASFSSSPPPPPLSHTKKTTKQNAFLFTSPVDRERFAPL